MNQFAKIEYSDLMGQVLCVKFFSAENQPIVEYTVGISEKDVMSIHIPFAATPEGIAAQKAEFNNFNKSTADEVAKRIGHLLLANKPE